MKQIIILGLDNILYGDEPLARFWRKSSTPTGIFQKRWKLWTAAHKAKPC